MSDNNRTTAAGGQQHHPFRVAASDPMNEDTTREVPTVGSDRPLGRPETPAWMRPTTPEVRRSITTHVVNDANRELGIQVLDDPGPGGANHLYQIGGFNTASNPSDPFVARYGTPAVYATVLFQHGPIKEVGVNGITHEALLAILIDRMEGFQKGKFACFENGLALGHLQEAADALKQRTVRRLEQGTEGTHKGA